METLLSFQDALLKSITDTFFRYIWDKISWKQRMIAIKGPRGTGKTTLLLQYLKFKIKSFHEAIYITADHPYFYNNSLFDFAGEWVNNGGKHLIVDEVHKYPGWSMELKNIYDGYPDLKVVFSASSALDIFRGEADLSRRVISYELPGMSFREYLIFTGKEKLKPLSWDDVINDHRKISINIANHFHPLPEFKKYLKYGYFPFTIENSPEEYLIKLQQTINAVIDFDMSFTSSFTPPSAIKMKKMLSILAEMVPYKPNISELASKLEISRDSVYSFLYFIKNARLLNFLTVKGKGLYLLHKPEKIYLENPNLAFALKPNPDIGNLRETFMVNQLINAGLKPYYTKTGDVIINDINIEIGGKNKSAEQIKSASHGIIASDDIETGFNQKIPLWIFGLLY